LLLCEDAALLDFWEDHDCVATPMNRLRVWGVGCGVWGVGIEKNHS